MDGSFRISSYFTFSSSWFHPKATKLGSRAYHPEISSEIMAQSFLPRSGNILDVPEKDFLGIFVDILRKAAQECVRDGRALLCLIFGHGIPNSSAIVLGTPRGKDPQHLTHQMFLDAITQPDQPQLAKGQIALLTTSRYGGGWTQYPSLNITAITASPKKEETLSWMESGSVRKISNQTTPYPRYRGSTFATSIVKL